MSDERGVPGQSHSKLPTHKTDLRIRKIPLVLSDSAHYYSHLA